MAKEYNVAVVGATGLVGREMIEVLEQRGFPVKAFSPLASARSAGEHVQFSGKDYIVKNAEAPDAFDGVEIVLMSAGGGPSRELSPRAATAGAVVIDNSSAWRMDEDVPLVVPEVNADAVGGYEKKRIIANPNCSTIQMVVALKPLHERFGLKRVVVSTYQAASGAGKSAMEELGEQVQAIFNVRDPEVKAFPKRLAFNCIPHIDVFQEDGFTKEERKMVQETRKIMGLPELRVLPTCVRVPVFNGHAESVVAEFDSPVAAEEARTVLGDGNGLVVIDNPSENAYPTQLDAEGQDGTYVGRIRTDPDDPNTLAFWCVADNIRKGAATNAVQIAEILVERHL
ncbi:MAG: aspartate-semialdehyde dehydrogenase [Myxococcota bacterium]